VAGQPANLVVNRPLWLVDHAAKVAGQPTKETGWPAKVASQPAKVVSRRPIKVAG